MITIVQETLNHRCYGVVSDTPTWRVVIPVMYEKIIPHKYGYSCRLPGESTWEAYTTDGTPLLKNCKNLLFLADDYLLFGAPNDKCFIFNHKTKTVVGNKPFDAVMVFIGDSDEATEFNSTSDVFDICLKTLYAFDGAHIESSVCVKSDGLWGVIDTKSNRITTDFTHKRIIHKAGNDITVID